MKEAKANPHRTAGSARGCCSILGPRDVCRQRLPNPLITLDRSGLLGTYSTSGPIDVTNPFFQDLGTNGRTCNSCHVSSQAWTVSAHGIRERFDATRGTGSHLPSGRRGQLSQRRHIDGSGAALRLQPAAEQGADPHLAACTRQGLTSRSPTSRILTTVRRPRPPSRRCTVAHCRRPTCPS